MHHNFYIAQNMFTKEELKQLNVDCTTKNNPNLFDRPATGITKKANVLIVPWAETKSFMERTFDLAKEVNKRDYCYDMFDYTDYDSINYNVYNSHDQGEYDWHTDSTGGGTPDDIKLTVIVNASTESYTGGTFEIFRNGPYPVEDFNNPGSVLVFPGFIPHRVTPVTQGKRVSVSYWITGPKFR